MFLAYELSCGRCAASLFSAVKSIAAVAYTFSNSAERLGEILQLPT